MQCVETCPTAAVEFLPFKKSGEDAIMEYQKILIVYPYNKKNDLVLMNLSKIFRYLKDFQNSIKYLNILISKYSYSSKVPEAYLEIANSYYLEGNL
mgnify:CR=1 FL=1